MAFVLTIPGRLKVKHLEDMNDIIEDENDDKVNVADDNNIEHKASLT